jgi:hypothetical protein
MNFLDKLLPFIKFSLFAKIGFLAIVLFFIIFLIIAVRQVFAMNTIVSESNTSFVVKAAILLLFVVAVSLFLTALVIL